MVISVRNLSVCMMVLLLGIFPLWGFAQELDGEPGEEPVGEQKSYGPIASTDTLVDIAIKLGGDGLWHYQRWMYALYQKNPQAFFEERMNRLKPGARLEIPTREELERVDLTEALQVVNEQFYMRQQESSDVQGGTKFAEARDGESNDELLLRARLQRLLAYNEMMQSESGQLFDKISSLEQQVGSVVDRVLASEAMQVKSASMDAVAPIEKTQSTAKVESDSLNGWWFALSGVAFIYFAGFIWRRRVEATL